MSINEYIMESERQWQISARVADREIIIELQEWSFLAMGEGHIVLQHNNCNHELYWKVLTICIHPIHSVPEDFEKLYFQIIRNTHNIKEYLLERELVELQVKERQILEKFLRLILKISNKNYENFIVYLSDNLNRSKEGWHYSLQFKPKAALSDKYSTIFIQKISQKLGINKETIVNTLDNRPVNEKNRWFKKNALKKVKKNMNPLQVFGVCTQINPNIIENLKKVQNYSGSITLTSEKREILNDFIVQTLRQSKILEAIAQIQLLFTGPSDFTHPDFDLMWEKQQKKTQILFNIKEIIQKYLSLDINISYEISQLFQSSIMQQPKQYQNDNERLESMFKFLMSWSWRDVSLFIRLKLNHQTCIIDDIDFKIIDYQLKESSKLKVTIEKDQIFLLNYLKYLEMI